MASMLEMDPESAIFKAIVEKLPSEGPETWDQEEPLGKIYCETKLRRYDMTKIKNICSPRALLSKTPRRKWECLRITGRLRKRNLCLCHLSSQCLLLRD